MCRSIENVDMIIRTAIDSSLPFFFSFLFFHGEWNSPTTVMQFCSNVIFVFLFFFSFIIIYYFVLSFACSPNSFLSLVSPLFFPLAVVLCGLYYDWGCHNITVAKQMTITAATVLGTPVYPPAWYPPAVPGPHPRGCFHLPSPLASPSAQPSLDWSRAPPPPMSMPGTTSSSGSRSVN